MRILSIDAWRYDGEWTWNNWFHVGDAPLAWADMTPRQLLRTLRTEGYLSPESRGRCAIEDDGHNVVILARGTCEPLFALEYGAEVPS